MSKELGRRNGCGSRFSLEEFGAIFPFSCQKDKSKRQTRRAGRRLQAPSLYRLALEHLEERTLLDANLNLIKMDLPPLLDSLQHTLNAKVLQNRLPLVGSQLQQVPVTQIFADLKTRATPKLAPLDNPTFDQITQTLTDAFGSLLQGPITGTEDVHQYTWDMLLNQSLTGADGVNFDLGLSGLGLGLDSNLSVNLQAGYRLHFKSFLGRFA